AQVAPLVPPPPPRPRPPPRRPAPPPPEPPPPPRGGGGWGGGGDYPHPARPGGRTTLSRRAGEGLTGGVAGGHLRQNRKATLSSAAVRRCRLQRRQRLRPPERVPAPWLSASICAESRAPPAFP